jgi:hypothetical protein
MKYSRVSAAKTLQNPTKALSFDSFAAPQPGWLNMMNRYHAKMANVNI